MRRNPLSALKQVTLLTAERERDREWESEGGGGKFFCGFLHWFRTYIQLHKIKNTAIADERKKEILEKLRKFRWDLDC